jgi:RNA-binding signal recognition particle 68
VKDELTGLDKAVSAVLGQRTIERNQLLVTVAKSKFRKQNDRSEKVTKPEELVRLFDLLIQVWCFIILNFQFWYYPMDILLELCSSC